MRHGHLAERPRAGLHDLVGGNRVNWWRNQGRLGATVRVPGGELPVNVATVPVKGGCHAIDAAGTVDPSGGTGDRASVRSRSAAPCSGLRLPPR